MPEPGAAARILVVEDEASLARGIAFNLELEGFEVEFIADGPGASDLLARPRRAVARWPRPAPPRRHAAQPGRLLGGPGGRGSAGNRTPDPDADRQGPARGRGRGTRAGADDYLPKPFDLTVFLARVRSLLRRREWTKAPASPGGAPVRIGATVVDFATFEVRVAGQTQRLTLLEAALLKLLWEQAGRVVGRGEILEKVWNLHPDTETRAVDNFIVRLRRYLQDDPRAPRHLLTVRGAGWRLDP